MKLKKKVAILLFIIGFVLSGCNDIFDELAINPNQPSMGAYFNSPSAVNDAVVTMYGYIQTQRCLGASGSKTQIIRSDEASSNSDYARPGMFGADLNSSYYTIEQPFTLMYTTASQASFIIETIDNVDFGTQTNLKNIYTGEAYFWRAFAHFYLLTNYRQVSPIRVMPKDASNYIRVIEPASNVWDLIIDDLKKAKDLLPERGYWNSKNAGRVTKAAAAALLGKSYLYRSGIEHFYGVETVGYYTEAANEFNEIIKGVYGRYGLADEYSYNFDTLHENEVNPESIFEINFLGDVNNAGFNPGTATSGLAFDSRGLMLPGAGVGYEGVVHDWLYNEFVNSIDKDGCTDIRMFSTLVFDDLKPEIKLHKDENGSEIRLEGPGGTRWEDLYPVSDDKDGFRTQSNVLAYPFKAGIKKGIDFSMPIQRNTNGSVKLSGVGGGVKEYVYNQPRANSMNWRYIRYADVLLMYAEAIISGGNQGELSPLEAVNEVRERANLPKLSHITMDDVKRERILELALEGHRFYDLLRWGELGDRFKQLQNEDPNFKKFVSDTDFQGFIVNKHEWLPIPINEMNSNPYIESNNPGY